MQLELSYLRHSSFSHFRGIMRANRTRNGLKVNAISGTYVVMLGFNLPKQSCTGLRGFAIHRVDHTSGEAGYITGMTACAETDPGFPAPAHYSTRQHPDPELSVG
ncbi:hypothetical protein [Bradyrhizobium glycinis]|uniref:hypothetical protein n=1 Tax=Bradyrhizobium glycinis TaxID=2751812 RepID=UPI0018D94720|nr:hypothetical protein [Bradyrhizobium glycinis]MBH5371058.1 hypothetical protein [Bradyrhizobium glycinis]